MIATSSAERVKNIIADKIGISAAEIDGAF